MLDVRWKNKATQPTTAEAACLYSFQPTVCCKFHSFQVWTEIKGLYPDYLNAGRNKHVLYLTECEPPFSDLRQVIWEHYAFEIAKFAKVIPVCLNLNVWNCRYLYKRLYEVFDLNLIAFFYPYRPDLVTVFECVFAQVCHRTREH